MGLFDRTSDTEVSDAELISRVRGGDVDAYGALFSRHVEAARRLARSLGAGADADDLVSEAFTKVLNVLRGGGGPDLAFRAYLLTAVRRVHVDRIRSQHRAVPTDDLAGLDDGVPFQDTVVEGFEGGAAARAFASLPERWQMVLWHLEVEGQKPADIAPMLGMSANSVSALAYRAREGLRQAFVQMHAADAVDEECARTHGMLGAYVRQGLSRRDNEKVRRHLDECRRCTALYLELTEVNSSLAAILGPVVLGGAAAAYLAGSGTSATAGLLLLLGRLRDTLASNAQTVLVTAGVAGVAAAATVATLVATHGPEHPIAAPGTKAPAVTTPHRVGGSDGSRPPRKHARHHDAPPATTPSDAAEPVSAVSSPGAATPSSTPPAPHKQAGRQPTPPSHSPSSPPAGSAPPAGSPSSSPPPNAPPAGSPPSSPPPSTPPPSTSGPKPTDISVSARLSLVPLRVQITVAGVPAGQQAQLTVSPLQHGLHNLISLVLGPGSSTQTVQPRGIGLGLLVQVSPPEGYVDTNPGNNRAIVRLR